jgi:hypothetical protein
MTREQAKECLSALRAATTDTTDPMLREALELAAKDAELRDWFDRQREFDDILIEKLASIRPPEGLKENILHSLSEGSRPIRWKTGWLALAATVLLAALLLNHQIDFFRGSSRSFRQFSADAMAVVSTKPAPKLDLETPSLQIAEAYIDAHSAPRMTHFPAKLQVMPTAGCRVFLWQKHPVSLTCFHLPSGKLLHLVVIRADAVGDSGMPTGLYSADGWHLMFQKKNGLILMWASQAPMDELKQIIET